ncbi:hypothetical protein AHAT_23110 [Agarivorans sp. Toyoura001]|uniref:hypothetical protein n=1 Tax=Agarivorans sp. Toyoura001 TaxID=2283141 RepID=UPI0010DCF97C|nr:hypothetical protein [Agarivorans sp. Toyoura001]GDY26421.1 hypothetical protein AHAT_23110 [Agarivorans sp. Toyoura001]
MEKEALELSDAIEVAEYFWSEYSNQDKDMVCWKLFAALLEMTRESPVLKAEKVDECYFTTQEVTARLEELAHKKANSYNGNRLSKEFNKLLERLEEVEVRLTQVARELGKKVIPWVVKEGSSGGQGRQTRYKLVAIKLKEGIEEVEPHSSTSHKGEIEYYLESSPKLPIWARWMQHINMDKYRPWVLLFTTSPIIFGLIALAQSYFTVFGFNYLYNSWIFTFSAIYSILFVILFRHFISAINYNIAALPEWALPMRLRSAVLQYELNKPGSDLPRLKSLGVKVYSAKCPICGHRVYIKPRGLVFKERLIGECDLNPVEHKYSFDFTTLLGSKIK